MRIEVKGRNAPVTDELRSRVERRCRKIEKQVSELARLEIEVSEERNPRISDSQKAEATLELKGVTLRAEASSHDMDLAVHEVCDDLARQVKRHRDRRRKRREARAASPREGTQPAL